MSNSISFHTLGCRLNQAETAILQSSFQKQGFQIVDFKVPADVVVVNTCTVTKYGDADTRKVVNRINRLNPEAKIALVGCQAQIQREALLQMPNVYWVVGNERKMELVSILRDSIRTQSPQVVTPVIKRKSFTHPSAGRDKNHTRANFKIQDGCDFFCSFCVIPFARGRARSRIYGDVVHEARQLVAAGHRELVLTGINVGTYYFQDKTILDIVDNLERIEGLSRLRISSIEPTTIPMELIRRAKRNSKLCRYFHIPLQSGSDEILNAMNRRYSVAEYKEFLLNLHKTIPEACLGTDVIVGFPGETEKHFRETYQLLRELPFAYFHVFSYSERPWTKSKKLGNRVQRADIEKHSKKLRTLSNEKRRIYLKKNLGSMQEVLFEQMKKGYWTGLTDTYIRVKVRSEKNLHNRLIPVRLERTENNAVIGKLV